MKKLIVSVFVLIMAFSLVTPALAAGPTEPSGAGSFCEGTGPLVFESVIPGPEWKCAAPGTYSAIQLWHSPAGPYNPTMRVDGLSFEAAVGMLSMNGLNSGSFWFVPSAAAPSGSNGSNTAPAGGNNGTVGIPGGYSIYTGNGVILFWMPLLCCLVVLFLFVLGFAFWLGTRRAKPRRR